MLEGFDPNTIADEAVRQVVIYLMNVVEAQQATIEEQAEKIQRQSDEINRLKGEQGKPKVQYFSIKTQTGGKKQRKFVF